MTSVSHPGATAVTHPEDGRPPLPVFTFIVLPNIILACIMALRPPGIVRVGASLVLLYAVVYAAMTYGVGSVTGNVSLASTVFGNMFLNIMLFTWFMDPVKEIRYLKSPGSLAEKPVLTRIWHCLCFMPNMRLIGTTAQVANVPPFVKRTRAQYILHRLRQIIFSLAMLDLLEAFIHTHHHLYDPAVYDAHLPAAGVARYLARAGCMAIWLLMIYSVLKLSYVVVATVSMATFLWEPEDWPEVFGNWSEAYTVRRLWGRAWHQCLRRHFSRWGNFAVNTLRIPRGTFLSSQVQVHVAFALSGLLHCIGDLAVGNSTESFGSSYPFFAANGLAITFEDAVVALAKRAGYREPTRTARWIGYAWVVVWFTWSERLYQESQYVVGVGKVPTLPYNITREIVLPFLRKLTGL
ncbi:membrane bound O-acyl transferase family-domain-containing protein [Trametes polyzona]|nr:membrane bound O-acyl transferase family-domain-containing protein [Trametes polyzona]